MKDKQLHIVKEVWTNVSRFVLAFVFIFSGFVKAVDPLGTKYKIEDYLEAFGIYSLFPSFFSLFASIFLAALEFSLGIYLFFGLRRKSSTLISLLLMLLMTPLTLYLAIKNPVTDCGCFGDALVLTNWQSFAKNLVLLIAAISAFLGRDRIIRFVSEKSQWLVALYTVLFVISLSVYCLTYLPVLDFRPYKIGKNIPEGMAIPSGAQKSVYESVFVLEKNNEKKEFSLENYPDSTWTFIDSRTVLREKGYEPPIRDFSITELESGEDITERVLKNKGYTFLLIAPRIDEADDSNIDLINEIYDYCLENKYSFYCLTSSLDYQIEQWRDKTGAEYPFCLTDEITLKTMIRSNPGLMLIKNGTILNKWNHSNLPDEYALSGRLENVDLGKQKLKSDTHAVGLILSWFIFPLLFFLGLDILVVKRIEKKRIENLLNPLINRKMRKNIVAGNWKMNKTLQEGLALATELNAVLADAKPNCDVVIGTPAIHLASVAAAIDTKKIGVAAQNCADHESGAYTGEISASMVKSTGADYVILGHSERREYYGETSAILNSKVALALANGLTPIYCCGEALEVRNADKQNAYVKTQLEETVFNLSADDFKKIVIAYEPIWAIGTGVTASTQQAQDMLAFIRSIIAEKFGKDIAEGTSILYGGSCNAKNAPELFAQPDIDGGLIGGASLKVADFKAIIDAF